MESSKNNRAPIDFALLIMLAATLCSIAIWTFIAVHMYTSYSNSGFFDLGQYSSSFTYMTSYPSIVHGLQYFVVSTHVAFDQLMILPFFYLIPSPITLLVIQVITISLTCLLAFFVARDLLGNSRIALALGLAMLLTPALQGLFVFDYHSEMLIVPFLILTFYFYMKRRTVPFAVSLILLLATIDTVVFIVISLGVGLLYYEFRYSPKGPQTDYRKKLALAIIVASIAALLFYTAYANVLQSSYAAGAYKGLPPYLHILPLDQLLISTSTSTRNVNSLSEYPIFSSVPTSRFFLAYSALGIIFGILIFGIAVLADPILSIIIAAPWLGELIILHRTLYASINFQYFPYVIGGSFVAAILGAMLIKDSKGPIKFTKISRRIKPDSLIVKSILVISFIAIIVGILIRLTSPTINATIYSLNPISKSCDSQINYLVSTLPKNSIIMTEDPISAHISTFKYPEVFSFGWYNQTPDYLLADFNTSCIPILGIGNYIGQYENFTNYIAANSMVLYETNGSASVYKSR